MNPKYTGILADIVAFLTILAALPYELGPVSDILPPEWKKYVATCGVVATLVLRLIKRGQTAVVIVPEVSPGGPADTGKAPLPFPPPPPPQHPAP